MPEYRRLFVPGGTYFFTLVTHRRRRILQSQAGRESLKRAWKRVESFRPFKTVALVLLPDHLHCIWRLPEGDADYPSRWAAIKSGFTRNYRELTGASPSRQTGGRRLPLWQKRYWEHAIHSEDDFRRHFDYIHYNPAKHGIVKRVIDWTWSTFPKYVKKGFYNRDWGYAPKEWMKDLATAGE